MGFNKRFINNESSIEALKSNNLKGYYGKSDALLFDDSLSSYIHELYCEGLNEEQILSIINKNMEEQTNNN
jgi:hypothetical protein